MIKGIFNPRKGDEKVDETKVKEDTRKARQGSIKRMLKKAKKRWAIRTMRP